MAQMTADYIIVGGGLSGSALAARLKQEQPSSHILLIEAGPDLTQDLRTKDLWRRTVTSRDISRLGFQNDTPARYF